MRGRALRLALALAVGLFSACTATDAHLPRSVGTRWIVEERHPDGSPLVEGREIQMPDGRWVAHGTWIQRYEDGSVEVEWERAFGSSCGPWTAYFEGGAVHIRTFFYGDLWHGPLIEYHYENGSPAAVWYHAMGEPVGRHISWTPSGQVSEDIDFREGYEQAPGDSQSAVDRETLAKQAEAALSFPWRR